MNRAPVEASAAGKVILFGEHAVVHGRPAIAVPVGELRASARLEPAPSGSGLTIVATDLGVRIPLCQAPPDRPLARAARLALGHSGAAEPDAICTIRSALPIASGLGSGAAVAAALIRGLASYLGHPISPDELSRLVFEVEKLHHGTPSGIDNTVVAYEQPVFFQRGRSIELLSVGAPIPLLIADTGVPSATRDAVSRIRSAWEREQGRYDALFDQVAGLVLKARTAIKGGEVARVGPLMDRNHTLLFDMGVSSQELETLVEAARLAGARGAKLSGAGCGGNMIALVDDGNRDSVAQALLSAGAANVFATTVV
jgi:mevalonate kinase